jgi:hypothetical protein
MARTKVFLRLPDDVEIMAATDLTGYGNVIVGEEFTARELWSFGKGKLIPNGRKLRVKVREVEVLGQSYHVLHVDILEDLTPQADSEELF